jgi:dTMP kinase
VPGPSDPQRGRFVVLEGIDGSGKSTQAALLSSALGAVLTSEPGATPLGMELRGLLLDPGRGPSSVRSEALLMAADRAEHVERVVEPALAAGRWVVSDRFTASTLAYQGFGRGLDLGELRRLVEFATSRLEPDLQVLLDLPVALARQRTQRAADRIENLGDDFFERVRGGYLSLAAAQADRWEVVDATVDPDTVEARISAAIRARLGPLSKDSDL